MGMLNAVFDHYICAPKLTYGTRRLLIKVAENKIVYRYDVRIGVENIKLFQIDHRKVTLTPDRKNLS